MSFLLNKMKVTVLLGSYLHFLMWTLKCWLFAKWANYWNWVSNVALKTYNIIYNNNNETNLKFMLKLVFIINIGDCGRKDFKALFNANVLLWVSSFNLTLSSCPLWKFTTLGNKSPFFLPTTLIYLFDTKQAHELNWTLYLITISSHIVLKGSWHDLLSTKHI